MLNFFHKEIPSLHREEFKAHKVLTLLLQLQKWNFMRKREYKTFYFLETGASAFSSKLKKPMF